MPVYQPTVAPNAMNSGSRCDAPFGHAPSQQVVVRRQDDLPNSVHPGPTITQHFHYTFQNPGVYEVTFTNNFTVNGQQNLSMVGAVGWVEPGQNGIGTTQNASHRQSPQASSSDLSGSTVYPRSSPASPDGSDGGARYMFQRGQSQP